MGLRNLCILLLLFVSAACSEVPITERKQTSVLPESYVQDMSLSTYEQFLQKNQAKLLPDSQARAKKIENIGRNIAEATENYLANHNQSYRVEDFNWEFNVVADSQVNAWCLPGGKIVFYTGIMDVAKNKDELAVVMGHEIAHAVAKHGNERMSQKYAVQAVGIVLSLFLSEQPAFVENMLLKAFGVGSKMGILAYSRVHETEADKMGLVFMNKAGYDPRAAVDFWKRMADVGGEKPPVFFSTHPSDEQRIKTIQEFIPKIDTFYRKKQGLASTN